MPSYPYNHGASSPIRHPQQRRGPLQLGTPAGPAQAARARAPAAGRGLGAHPEGAVRGVLGLLLLAGRVPVRAGGGRAGAGGADEELPQDHRGHLLRALRRAQVPHHPRLPHDRDQPPRGRREQRGGTAAPQQPDPLLPEGALHAAHPAAAPALPHLQGRRLHAPRHPRARPLLRAQETRVIYIHADQLPLGLRCEGRAGRWVRLRDTGIDFVEDCEYSRESARSVDSVLRNWRLICSSSFRWARSRLASYSYFARTSKNSSSSLMATFSCFWKCTSRWMMVRWAIRRCRFSSRIASPSARRRSISRSRNWALEEAWMALTLLSSSTSPFSRQLKSSRSSLEYCLSSRYLISLDWLAAFTSYSLTFRCSSDRAAVFPLRLFSAARRFSISLSRAVRSLSFSALRSSSSTSRPTSSSSSDLIFTRLFSRLRAYLRGLPSSSPRGFTNSSEKPWKKSSGSRRTRLILLNLMNFCWGESSAEREGLVRLVCGLRWKRGREQESLRESGEVWSRLCSQQLIHYQFHFYITQTQTHHSSPPSHSSRVGASVARPQESSRMYSLLLLRQSSNNGTSYSFRSLCWFLNRSRKPNSTPLPAKALALSDTARYTQWQLLHNSSSVQRNSTRTTSGWSRNSWKVSPTTFFM